MSYSRIENDEQLRELDAAVCWDDSDLLECYVSSWQQSFFPPDISYSGHESFHLHCLYRVCSAPASHLELVFIGCDDTSLRFIHWPHLHGRVAPDRHIELVSADGKLQLRCTAISYRFIDLDDDQCYLLRPGVLDRSVGELEREGYHCISGQDAELIAITRQDTVEVTIADDAGLNATATLDRAQAAELAETLLHAIAALPRS